MKRYMMRVMITLSAIIVLNDVNAMELKAGNLMKLKPGNIRVRFMESGYCGGSVDVPRESLCANVGNVDLKKSVSAYFGFDVQKVEQLQDTLEVEMSRKHREAITGVVQIDCKNEAFKGPVNHFYKTLEHNAQSLASSGVLQEDYDPQTNRALNTPFGRYRMHNIVLDCAAEFPAQLMGDMKKAIGKIEQTANNNKSQLDENYKQFFYDLADDFDNELIEHVLEGDSLLKEKHYNYLEQYPEVIEKHIQEKRKKLSPQEVEAKKQQLKERMQQCTQQHAHNPDFIKKHTAVMQAIVDQLSSTGKKDSAIQKQNTSNTTQSISTQLSAISTSTLIKIGILAVGAAVITWVAVKFYNHGNTDEQREDVQEESSTATPSQQREKTALIAQ